MSDEKDSGLYIDSDWKEEAAREKEKLAEQDEKTKPQEEAPASFLELVNLLMMQAIVGLGGYPGPNGEALPANPAATRHFIDLLGVLKTKTEGNLTEDETKTLDGVLHELRAQFVQAMSAPPPPAADPK